MRVRNCQKGKDLNVQQLARYLEGKGWKWAAENDLEWEISDYLLLVKGYSHDTVSCVKCLFDTIPMMNIDVNVQGSLVDSQKFQDSQDNIVDIAEPAGLDFLRMMQTSGPVYRNVAFLTIKTGCTLHASTNADPTEIKKIVKDWTIITNVKLGLLGAEVLQIFWRDSLQEIDIVVGVKLGHFQWSGCLGSLKYIVSASSSLA
jgi:hypothetical protein